MAPNRPDIKRKPFAWKVYVLCTVYEKVYVLGTSNGGTRPRYRPCCFAPGYFLTSDLEKDLQAIL